MRCALCAVRCALCAVPCALCAARCALCAVLSGRVLPHNVALCAVRCALCPVRCALCVVRCALCAVCCDLCTVRCALRLWEPFGRSKAFSVLFLDFAGLCWPFLAFSWSSWPFLVFSSLFSPFLGFAGLCWHLLGFNACYYCRGRAKRASKASERSSLVLSLGFPCLPLLSLAYPCFLLLSVASLLCMLSGNRFEWYFGIPSLILYSVSGCSLPSFVFSRFTLCQHFLKKIALPVHLLRQVPLECFFRYFFESLFNIVFDEIFHRFWKTKPLQNPSNITKKSMEIDVGQKMPPKIEKKTLKRNLS